LPRKHFSPDQVSRRRREAVRLRLDGLSVAEAARRAGVSAPTVTAAFAAFRAGGWPAVEVGRRGRPRKADRPGPDEASALRAQLLESPGACRDALDLAEALERRGGTRPELRSVRRHLAEWGLVPKRGPLPRARTGPVGRLLDWARAADAAVLAGSLRTLSDGPFAGRYQLTAQDARGRLWFALFEHPPRAAEHLAFWREVSERLDSPIAVITRGIAVRTPALQEALGAHGDRLRLVARPPRAERRAGRIENQTRNGNQSMTTLTHLQRLEAESIHIMREVVAETDNPVMLYSIGKDSAVMLHLARKAFAPGPPPFPLLHVDTRWKFRAMYEFRDRMAEEVGMDLLVHVNPEGIEKDIDPFTHGSAIHTDVMKTEGLKQALDKYGFDAAFGGARRDEEKSRAKERIFSFRTAQHRWDPKNQRPELWKLYNARKHKGESIRVFPLSNWTELDIWQYIHLENIPIVPLYYAAERPVVERDGTLIMVDDERMPLHEGEVPMMKKVRFRTLGCYPLTGAIESEADTLPDIIQEMLLTKTSERQGRVIDHDSAASMEKKKQEGYF
jgi:sulfate adenylyltransferase subunit 2